jgi:hypothetical protein
MVSLGFMGGSWWVSADGSTIAGPGDDNPFRWTAEGGGEAAGCIDVVGLSEDFCTCWLGPASSDFSVMAGECTTQHGGGRLGFVWLAGRKALEIREALAAQSDISDIDLGQMGWSESSVTAVSDNGKFIAGWRCAGWGCGWDDAPSGAWLANIPEPSTLVLVAVWLIGLLGYSMRARLRC